MTKKTVAFCTLGCRVNQYETRAVEEAFMKKGFTVGKFTDECDAYVINTCTVTGESDRKSRQMIRRAVKNGNGKAVGYIICAEEYDSYKKIFDDEYLELNKHLHEDLYNWAVHSTDLQNKHKSEYPAHLHIDLAPPYHRKGFGSQLIKTLCEHLKAKGVKGVMLTVGNKNESAIKFYEKCGFSYIEHEGTEIAFGIKLN